MRHRFIFQVLTCVVFTLAPLTQLSRACSFFMLLLQALGNFYFISNRADIKIFDFKGLFALVRACALSTVTVIPHKQAALHRERERDAHAETDALSLSPLSLSPPPQPAQRVPWPCLLAVCSTNLQPRGGCEIFRLAKHARHPLLQAREVSVPFLPAGQGTKRASPLLFPPPPLSLFASASSLVVPFMCVIAVRQGPPTQ